MDQQWPGGGSVALDIPVIKLALGTLSGPLSVRTPITAFAIRHPSGTVLVDTGIGTPAPSFAARYPTKARSVTDALAEHGIAPSDVICIVNSQMHTNEKMWTATLDRLRGYARYADEVYFAHDGALT